jgi:CheY-like chemotaxis protein
MKVLIVDDDADILRMIQKLLVHRGHVVSACSTPFGVSALVMREHPDVVVLDMMMPGLSGASLAELIGKLNIAYVPKMVLWSAMDPDQLADEGTRLGIPVVSKALRPSALIDAIEHMHASR